MKKKLLLLIILISLVAITYLILTSKDKSSNQEIIPDNSDTLIGSDIAISLLKEVPKIKEWLSLFNENTDGEAKFEILNNEGDSYYIHVYEQKSTHMVTFDFFSIDLNTKEIISDRERNFPEF